MRNRRSFEEANKEYYLRKQIDASLASGNSYILARPRFLNKESLSADALMDNQFPYSYGSESSSTSENELRYKLTSDIETCKNMLEKEIDFVSTSHRSYMNAFYSSEQAFKKLESEANRELLLSLSDDPFSYGITDDFKEYSNIDFEKSTTTVYKDKILLNSNSFDTKDLDIKRISTSVSAQNGAVLSVNEISDTNNIKRKDGSSFKVKANASSPGATLELEVLIELRTEANIDKLLVSARSVEGGEKEGISVAYTKDGSNYIYPNEQPITRLENLNNMFDIYDTDIKAIKVKFFKYAADTSQNLINQYIYSIDYIGIAEYKFDSYGEFYSLPYEITDEDDNAINFTLASMLTGTCCTVPKESSISFFLSKDGENYIPVSYFEDSSTVVEFVNQINRNIFTRINENNLDLIEESDSVWKLNNYIPVDVSFVESSLVIKRNLNKWFKKGAFYYCTIEIDNDEGLFIDFKDSICTINGVERRGRVFLPKGEHSIKTTNYREIRANLSSETALRSLDPFYPTNHKYLLEGYSYGLNFNGEKVYAGVDNLYEAKLTRVDENFFNLNSDRRDIYYLETTDEGSFIYINKAGLSNQEEIFLDGRINDNNVDNKLYIKAILESNNPSISPRIDSIQVRVI